MSPEYASPVKNTCGSTTAAHARSTLTRMWWSLGIRAVCTLGAWSIVFGPSGGRWGAKLTQLTGMGRVTHPL